MARRTDRVERAPVDGDSPRQPRASGVGDRRRVEDVACSASAARSGRAGRRRRAPRASNDDTTALPSAGPAARGEDLDDGRPGSPLSSTSRKAARPASGQDVGEASARPIASRTSAVSASTRSGPAVDARERRVVVDHRHTVGRQPDVELEAVAGRDRERGGERRERVLRRAPPVAAMGQPERWRAGHSPTRPSRLRSTATRQRERERAAGPLDRLDPDPAAVLLDDVARDGKPEPGRRRPRRGRAPGRPCRSARRSAAWAARGMPTPWSSTDDDDVRRPIARTATTTSPPSGLNFTALWSEVDDDLAEPGRVAADRRAAARATSTRRVTPWRSANSRSRSVDSVATWPRSRTSRTPSAPPLSIRDRSSSSLTIWTRWPGLDLDLVDPVAHPGRDGVARRLGLAGQRLGQQADRRQRRAQLVRQVVDELGPDLLEPAQLGDVLEDEPQAARRGAPGADDEPRPVGAGRARPRRSPSRPRGRRCAIASTCVSRNASITVRPTSVRGCRVRAACAAARLAATMRRPSSTVEDALRERIDERVAVSAPGQPPRRRAGRPLAQVSARPRPDRRVGSARQRGDRSSAAGDC